MVAGRRGGAVGQAAVRSAGVVVGDEGVEQGLQLGDGGGLVGLGSEPVLHRLLDAFDFAAGGGVVGPAVLLLDVELSEFCFEAVAAASAAGEAGGEDHAVVGQGAGWDAVGLDRCAECGEHDRSGDPAMGADVQQETGAVVEPGEDLDIGPVGEAVVGEVGLPGLVRLCGFEPDVAAAGPLLRLRGDQAGGGELAADRRG